MALIVRPARPTDEGFLREMLLEALFAPPDEQPFPSAIVREEPRLSALVDGFGTADGDAGSVAELDGEPVGAAWIRLVPDGYGFVEDGVPELSVAIRPEQRGQGIGGSLLSTVLASVERVVPGVSLSCDDRNRARRLYERFGFEEVRFEEPHSVVMLRRFAHDDLVPMAPIMPT
jgi:ribosomal protein S18 acetylase RimI-like enzyme